MVETNNARWVALALLFIARIGLGFQFQTLGSVSENLVTELAFDYTEVGVLIGLFMVPGMFLALPAGFSGRFASDRFIIGIGLMILAAGGFLAALAGSFELLAIGRLICGIGFVFSTIFFTKMVADWFAGKELATAMSILVMSWPLGIAMGQVGHGWIALNYDWPLAFTVASIYCLVSAFLIMIFCKEAPNIKKSAGGFQFSLNRTEVFLIFISSLVWAFFNAAYVVYLSFAPISLVADGYDTLTALSTVSLASWLMIFSISLCGFISDKSGKPDILIYICMAGAVIALVLLIYTPMAIPSSLLFGFLGVAPAGVIMALTAEAMKPENRAIGMGLFFSIYFLIQALAPPIAGWLFDLTGNSNWPILFAMALFAVTALTTYLFRIAVRRYPL